MECGGWSVGRELYHSMVRRKDKKTGSVVDGLLCAHSLVNDRGITTNSNDLLDEKYTAVE